MVQAAPDARDPDGRAGRTIWEGTRFPSEGGRRGREGRKRESGAGKEGREGERKGWEERERREEREGVGEGWRRKTEAKRGFPAFVKWREPPPHPTPAALADRLLPCRPHAVDAGARAAVAGVGDQGVQLDGDRHRLFPEHGRQGTV